MSRTLNTTHLHKPIGGVVATVLLTIASVPPALGQDSIWMPAFSYKKEAGWVETVAASLTASSITVPVADEWYYVGPFDNDLGRGLETAYPPEKEISLDDAYEGKNDRLIRWNSAAIITDGRINDLQTQLGVDSDSVIYLYRTIYSPIETEITASLGSDVPLAVWLNGLKLLSKDVTRSVAPDQDRVDLPLRAGENELLVKLCIRGGGLGFYFSMPTHIPSAIESPLLLRLIRDFPADPRVDRAYQRLYEIRRERWKDYALPQLDVLGVNVKDFGAAGIGEMTNGNIDGGARVITNVSDMASFAPGQGIYLWQFTPVDGVATVQAASPDCVASVRLRPQPGGHPSEAGLAFRVADAENYWALSAQFQNAEASRAMVRLLRVRNGSPVEIRAKQVDRPASATATIQLKVVLEGEDIRALVNDRALFELTNGFNVDRNQTGLYHNAEHRAGSPLFLDFRIGSEVEDDFDRTDNPHNLGAASGGRNWTAVSGRWGIANGMATRTEGARGQVLASTVVSVSAGEIEIAHPWPGANSALVEIYHDDTAAIKRALRVGLPQEPHLIFPEGAYNVSRTVLAGSSARLSGLSAESGAGAAIQALPGIAPEQEDEKFVLAFRSQPTHGSVRNGSLLLENVSIAAIHPETNPGLSGVRLASIAGGRCLNLSVDVPGRGVVVAEKSQSCNFETVDIRAGETGLDILGRGAASLTISNLRLRRYDTAITAVGIRIRTGSAGVLGQAIACEGLDIPVQIHGATDVTLLGINALDGHPEYPVVDVGRATDDLSLMVSGTADGYLKAVSVGGEAVAWVREPGDPNPGPRPFRFVGGQSSLWMGSTDGGGQANFIGHIRPNRSIAGGDSLVVDLIDTRTRGGGCASYDYVVKTDDDVPTVELGTLRLLHNEVDFQMVRTVVGRVGPNSTVNLFTPDAEMRDGLLSLRVRSDVASDRAIWFSAQKTGLGLPGPRGTSDAKGAVAPSDVIRAPSKPGADGYIRDWLVLGPVPFRGDSPDGVLAVDDLNGEAKIQPEPGQDVVVRGKRVSWRPVRSDEPILDVSLALRAIQRWDDVERAFGYLVVYLETEHELPNLTLEVDHDDPLKVWLNGSAVPVKKQSRQFGEFALASRAEKADVRLTEGKNVLVLKTTNDAGKWAVGIRFKDLDGRPLSDCIVSTNP